MPVRTVIERGPKGKRSVAFGLDWPGWSRGAKSAELALETLESYRRALPADRGPRRDGRRVRRSRAHRGRGGQGRDRFDRLLGHLLLALRDRAGSDGRGGARARDHAAAGMLGVLRRRRGAGLARDAQGAARGRTRPRPDHQPHHPRRKRGLRDAGRVADPGGGGADPGWAARSIGRPMSRRCARTTQGSSSGACGRGRCRSSSDTLPSTRSTMRGRWRTRTSPFRKQAGFRPARRARPSRPRWWRRHPCARHR